jgi:two-component system, OmpR family, sensor histidine kinase VicK
VSISNSQNSARVNKSTTEVFYGVDTVTNKVIEFLYQTADKIDACVDYTRPSLAIDILVLKEAFLSAKNRGVKLRYITEITRDNIFYCKQLMTIVDELRHLDGIMGNFYISENGYLAPATFHEAGVPAAQVIYSNVKELIEHQRYIFQTLWNKTIPAVQRIREIEEGLVRYETRIIDTSEQIIDEISSLTTNSNELAACFTSGGMHYSYNYFFEIQKNLLGRQKTGRHKGIKYVTNINNENVNLTKLYLDLGVQIRHLSNLPPLSFGVSDTKIALTIEKMEGGNVIQSLLVSNEPNYLKHFYAVFQELWENGIDAIDRIREIEEGTEPAKIEIIRNPNETVRLSQDLAKSARHEILRIYPSINQFRRQVRIGVLHLFREAMERGLSIKVLVPGDEEQIKEIINEVQLALPNLEIRSLDKSLQTQIGVLVVDRRDSVIIELKDDTKDSYFEASGLAAYSNSKPISMSYASIFEALWKQGKLYDQLKSYSTMQKEFINIAAHELRTPVQPILGLSQVLLSEETSREHSSELLRIICRNAERLRRLIEDILDVTKIESQSLHLKKERFNLSNLILTVISECERQSQIDRYQSHKKIVFNAKDDFYLIGDRGRISQVLYNLLTNALKFTEAEDTIFISVEKKDFDNHVTVAIIDTGIGINSEIFPRLFTKFASKSEKGGTGLGLYISKSIVEAHNGKIWAENNSGGGAKFTFSLPVASEV